MGVVDLISKAAFDQGLMNVWLLASLSMNFRFSQALEKLTSIADLIGQCWPSM